MELVVTTIDPVINDIFKTLESHVSDRYMWPDVLKTALQWVESANPEIFSISGYPPQASAVLRISST
jgi:hypothetical protein